AISKKDSLKLLELGHQIKPLNELNRGLTFVGRVVGILVLKNGQLEAGADSSRGDDSAAGF
ncbi:MAG TPA: hypothetical protein VFM90_13460, partial [Cyclobacteriaceae bacterium]|nr:hypothetical protein [Cyclobacteriaceae bacterium]